MFDFEVPIESVSRLLPHSDPAGQERGKTPAKLQVVVQIVSSIYTQVLP